MKSNLNLNFKPYPMKKLILSIGFMLAITAIQAQTKQVSKLVPIKTEKAAKQRKTNKQGYELPVNAPDTCRVYAGSKGGLFIYRKSEKSGKVYKQYLPK